MTTHTAGNLDKFYYDVESTYGTSTTNALAWGCETISFKPNVNMMPQFHVLPGDRGYAEHTRDVAQIGFNLKGYSRKVDGAFDWTDFWAVYGFGSATGFTERLGSFTAQISKTKGGTTYYDYYPGSKFNRSTIGCEGLGKPIMFEAECFSQWVDQDTDKSRTGIQTVTQGADPAAQTQDLLDWSVISQINIAGGGLANWHPVWWRIITDHHLERQPGVKVGGDSNNYHVAVALDEGARDVIFECELRYEDETYTAAKLADSLVTEIEMPLGTAKKISLSNGYFETNDFPEYKQAIMNEPIRIRFPKASVLVEAQ